jgi:hypothetical protein
VWPPRSECKTSSSRAHDGYIHKLPLFSGRQDFYNGNPPHEVANNQDSTVLGRKDLREKRPDLSKYTFITHVLRIYEGRGLAMRYLNSQGKIAWLASPNLINKIREAERETEAEFEI